MSLIEHGAVAISVFALALVCSLAHAVELDPAAVAFKLPDQIEWKKAGEYSGLETAVLAGDPSKSGLYVVMVKWLAGDHFSHPHFHPHDRFITVLKGTWWVGSGTKFDTNATVPMPAGTFVPTTVSKSTSMAPRTRTLLLIVGEGPATATPESKMNG